MRLRSLLGAALLGLAPGTARPTLQAPPRLSQTGLYAAPGLVAARNLAYAPQYPLWTDGAAKARWLHLPAGTAIDGRDEAAWVFPVGTKAWKEFAFQGRKVETRLLWKTGPRTWVLATYAWNAEQTDAFLVPEEGRPGAVDLGAGARHDLPSRADCRTCHGQGQVDLLGLTALQLSPDRDPGALHGEPVPPGGVTLRELVARRLLVGARPDLLTRPPRILADNPTTRAILGYLAGNCAACHRPERPLTGLDLDLRPSAGEAEVPALRTTVGRPSLYQTPGAPGAPRIQPGDPGRSTLLHRMASRRPASQMPPLGTALPDTEALARLRAWIAALPPAAVSP